MAISVDGSFLKKANVITAQQNDFFGYHLSDCIRVASEPSAFIGAAYSSASWQ
jgi:hypothetical protein